MFNFSKTSHLELFLDWLQHIKSNVVFGHMTAFAPLICSLQFMVLLFHEDKFLDYHRKFVVIDPTLVRTFFFFFFFIFTTEVGTLGTHYFDVV